MPLGVAVGHNAFLRHGRDQLALLVMHRRRRQASSAPGVRADAVEVKPAVRPERPVEPDGVVQACHIHRAPFRQQFIGVRAEATEVQPPVGQIGKYAFVQACMR